MPVRPDLIALRGRRVRLSAEGLQYVKRLKGYYKDAPTPQEWVGVIKQATRAGGFYVKWDHCKKLHPWHRKYVEIIDDRTEALVPGVRTRPEEIASTPPERVRPE